MDRTIEMTPQSGGILIPIGAGRRWCLQITKQLFRLVSALGGALGNTIYCESGGRAAGTRLGAPPAMDPWPRRSLQQ